MYTPSKKILDKYADVLINYALNSGKGVKAGEIVFLNVPECAKPLLVSLRRAVLKAGAHPLINYMPDGMSREFFELANEKQLEYFPAKLLKGRIDEITHLVGIIAEPNKHELEGIPPKKLMHREKFFTPYMQWRNEKENAGKFTWTLALYGTEAMAKEAGLSPKEFWQQIIKACYLNDKNPVKTWVRIQKEVERIKVRLDTLRIEKVHIEGKNIDLTIGLGKNRAWMGGSGRNIPSFEHFISPNNGIAEGYIYLNQPLYRYGNVVEGIRLEFKQGKVVKATAKKGQELLRQMIATKGADRIGEFSLTDKRFSKIDKFMAETLFDENFGGKYGNTH
ncbi:MAG: aminopeptidase, partial [archaeon]